MKLSIRLLSALIVVIIVSLQASSTPTLAAGRMEDDKDVHWYQWNKDTEDFNGSNQLLADRLHNQCRTASSMQHSVSLSTPAAKLRSYVASVTFDKSGTDTSYVRAGPGDFWIKVIAANLRSWTIEVQTQQ